MEPENKHEPGKFPTSPSNVLMRFTGEKFSEALFRSPSIFAVLTGPEMTIEFANEALLRSWHRDQTVIGKPLLEVLPEIGTQAFPRLLLEAYNSGIAYFGYEEKAVISKNGIPTDTYYNYVYQPVFSDNGTVSGIAVMATDVTEQVEGRKKIEESEERFRALVTATSYVVYRMSPDWQEMRELQGRGFLSDTGEPLAGWLSKYIHPKDQERVMKNIQAAIDTKSIFELEHQVLRKDGTLGWTFSRAVPIFNDEGEIIEWFGAASDITERKQMEQALTLAKEQSDAIKRLYETVINNTPDLVYVFDLQYRFTYANQALLAMWGKTSEQAIGKNLQENGYEPWHAEMHEREIDQVVATKQPIRGEVSFPHARLGRRIYDYIFVPVINEHGVVEAVAGTTRDITEIKEAEAALQRSRDELEVLVRERTRALQQSNEDLQQFAYVASHDLKEPVRKISTFASHLYDQYSSKLDNRADQLLNKIRESAGRMYRLIDDILAYSSLQQIDFRPEPVDLNALMRDIEADLEVLIEQKGASITFADLPPVKGSWSLLSQLFSNLVTNSLKFSRQGLAPAISISACAATAGELAAEGLSPQLPFVRIYLEDNGIGFRQQDAQTIFHSFTRLNAREQYEGTGLGLALCKRIVERHGGAIRAAGKEEQGAVFTIYLPGV